MCSPSAAMWDSGIQLMLGGKYLYPLSHLNSHKINTQTWQSDSCSSLIWLCTAVFSLPITLSRFQTLVRIPQTGPRPPRLPNDSNQPPTIHQSTRVTLLLVSILGSWHMLSLLSALFPMMRLPVLFSETQIFPHKKISLLSLTPHSIYFLSSS